MDNGSYIKLHRKMLQWEWYDHDNTKILFLHLLLTASWKESRWHGITLQPGELIRTNENLGQELGKSIKQIRAALENLKRTGEVATRFESGIRIITVKNWDQYQKEGSQTGNQRAAKKAGEGQQDGQPKGSTRAAYKESKESKNVRSVYTPHTAPTFSEVQEFCFANGYQNVDVAKFMEYNEAAGWKMDWKKAVELWWKKDKERGTKRNNFGNIIEHEYDFDALEAALMGGRNETD